MEGKITPKHIVPNYAGTRHHIPETVINIVLTTVFVVLPISLQYHYTVFFFLSVFIHITLSLNTTSQNLNIITNNLMSWHFIQINEILTE